MSQPVRILELTPLGYIIEFVNTGTRIMLPKLILKQKIDRGVYTLHQSKRSGDI